LYGLAYFICGENLLKPVDVQPINDINQAIGRAVTTLIAAGVPVEKYAILAE